MRPSRTWLVCLTSVFLLGTVVTLAAQYEPPPPKKVAPDILQAIAAKTHRLGKLVTSLQRRGLRDSWLAEIEVYHKAAEWIVRHNEFFQADSPAWTLEALDHGLFRAAQVAEGGLPQWLSLTGFPVVRAYRSNIDGSVQPYAVTLPPNYLKNPNRKWRLDVVLHGRDSSLTEVKFLHRHNGEEAAAKDQDFVRLDIYGRGNNAYRWAGEADVFEALQAFIGGEDALGRAQLLNLSRVVLRGFSMGGAGTWHLGLHFPDRWCVLGPGAGFTATHGYVKGLPAKLPAWQERCLHIYDAVDYAENVFEIPVVAYAGARDAQLQAARNIEAALQGATFPFQLKVLVAPDLGHQFPLEWQKKAEAAYAPFVEKERAEYPGRVRFVTWTLRYANCHWVQLLALDRHYDRALVDAERTEGTFTIKTANVRALRLTLPPGATQEQTVKIDAQGVSARPWIAQNGTAHLYLERRKGTWTAVLPQRFVTRTAQQPRKASGLQGPIDDAFTDAFLCIRGTGKAWHDATGKYAEANLERFRQEWSKYWRGDLPVKDDVDVNDEDIDRKHLILFGDPSSNSLLAQVLDGLPLEWTASQIVLDGKSYPAGEHVPALIYPSPLKPGRYVVLNSGHTFHAAEYVKTNALLYPYLGDYAVLRLTGGEDPLATEVVTAGLFDDSWQLGRK